MRNLNSVTHISRNYCHHSNVLFFFIFFHFHVLPEGQAGEAWEPNKVMLFFLPFQSVSPFI